jgi:hypothetical protein
MEASRLKALCLSLSLLLWAVVLSVPARAEDGWPHRRVAGPFVVLADFPLEQSGPLIGELAVLQRDVSQQLGIPATREAVQLYWFARQSTYEQYVRRYFPGVPARRALYIKGRGPGRMLAYQHAEFDIDVRHESTHALLNAVLTQLPLWLDEGLAEYYEVPRWQRLKGNPHLPAVVNSLRQENLSDLRLLEQFDDVAAMGTRDYEAAWAWVHFLLHGPTEARQELRAYLSDLYRGADAGPFSGRLARRIPDLRDQLRRHFVP